MQMTANELRISVWSSDVCSSDLATTMWPFSSFTRNVVLGSVSRITPAISMWSSFAIRLYRSVRRAALSGKPSRASTRDGFRDVDLAGLAYVQRAPLRPLQRFQRMESALVILLAAAFYPVNRKSVV